MKFKKIACTITLCTLFAFVPISCAQEDTVQLSSEPDGHENSRVTVTAPPVPTPEPTPTPSPTPTPIAEPTSAEVLEQLAQLDILEYIPANTYEDTGNLHAYEVITADPEKAYDLRAQYKQWFDAAAQSIASIQLKNIKTEFIAPSWQMLSTIAYNFAGDEVEMRNALMSVCELNATIAESAPSYSATISATPRKPAQLFYSLPSTESTTPMGNLFTYAYLVTIYDDEMNVRDGIGTPPLEDLYFPMETPEKWYVGDTWGASRDGGARRHTGTDINAPEGTNLLACVNGTILDAGDGEGTGYYIVVEGADGTQYHYYHLVEPPVLTAGTEVQAGDVVGLVGNTGNSTANHLHFTIITSDGFYLNPYTYLQESQEQTIALNNEAAADPEPDENGEDAG